MGRSTRPVYWGHAVKTGRSEAQVRVGGVVKWRGREDSALPLLLGTPGHFLLFQSKMS